MKRKKRGRLRDRRSSLSSYARNCKAPYHYDLSAPLSAFVPVSETEPLWRKPRGAKPHRTAPRRTR